MDSGFISTILDWVSAHPNWAGTVVLLISLFESLALVGLFMPGVVLMFAIGALIGSGNLEFWPTVAWAAAGAVAGDSISFWLGRRFHQKLRVLWPFRTHPGLVGRATDFFHRHGGKSILFGRFVGPIRPIVPAIAGMMEMPSGRFLFINVVSALLWAPTYLAPGVVIGASLGLAAEVGTRLAILLVAFVAFVIGLGWGMKALFNLLHPRAHAMISRLLEWTRLHPVAGEVPAALLDPTHREAKGLTILAAILLLAGASFVVILTAAEGWLPLAGLDQFIHETLLSFRTPLIDRLMVGITELGDPEVLVVLFGVLLAWLLWHRRWPAAAHWSAAVAFAVVLTRVLAATTEVLRPTSQIPEHSFPSGHALNATVVYGFLAVLIAREIGERYRWIAYAVIAPLVGAIAFSRLYLGAAWFSEVLGGLTLGVAWVAFLGIAYRRHPAATLPLGGLILAAGISLSLTAAWHMERRFDADLQRYSVSHTVEKVSLHQWWDEDWRTLPAYRSDLRQTRRYPLNLQFAGSLADLRTRLLQSGWKAPAPLTVSSWLHWLAGPQDISRVPLLPQIHGGQHESLVLIKSLADKRRAIVVRLWSSDMVIGPRETQVWLGTVSRIREAEAVPGVTVPRTMPEFDGPLHELLGELSGVEHKVTSRPLHQQGWTGSVALVYGSASRHSAPRVSR